MIIFSRSDSVTPTQPGWMQDAKADTPLTATALVLPPIGTGAVSRRLSSREKLLIDAVHS
jgi:hypothetical protein